ncbi:MAG: phosphoribosyltransferase [Tepidisphaeraceae bacterium]
MDELYTDRHQAGRSLAAELLHYRQQRDVVVLGLPRGGVPVAFEVARALAAPLDILIVRKLGVPWQTELAMGAIASGNVRVLNERTIDDLSIDAGTVDAVAARERHELERRERAYRQGRHAVDLQGKTVILVDDGLATGASMRAAVIAVRHQSPVKVVVAVPVGAAEACEQLSELADDVVCPYRPEPFFAIGRFYDDFAQTTDADVEALLEQAARKPASGAHAEGAS